MKNKIWIIIIAIVIIGICIGAYFLFKNNNSNSNDYTSKRTSTNQNIDNQNNSTKNTENTNSPSNETNTENNTNSIHITQNSTGAPIKSEEEISSFSTPIVAKESSRQNNVTLTCNSLNDTIVPNGSTFSFCNTLGPAKPEQGYQEADVFDEDGNKIKGIGGGKCQVSTTLYNAVLNTPRLSSYRKTPS